MPSVTKDFNLSFYFILINFNLNSHMCLVVAVLDRAVIEGELFKGTKSESKGDFREKCSVQATKPRS